VFSNAAFRRAGLDYLETATIFRHRSWEAFLADHRRAQTRRLVLLTTKAPASYVQHVFTPDDTILLGRESVGVPADVHDAADVRLRIPLKAGRRSLKIRCRSIPTITKCYWKTIASEYSIFS